MRAMHLLVALCTVVAASAAGPVRAEMAPAERVVLQDSHAADVVVEDVRGGPDAVSGVIVNRGRDPVRNVRLVISHVWLWDNEFHPGNDDLSRVEKYMVPDEIPPGRQVPFTVRPSAPLPEASGGHFMPDVSVASFDEIHYPSPTAGTSVAPSSRPLEGDTRAVQPSPRRLEDEGMPAPPARSRGDDLRD